VLRQDKVAIIARAARVLDPAEARAIADRNPPGVRFPARSSTSASAARAVMQVAPDKARIRREKAARDARVERWPEDSGNAALAGRELSPAEVLAADQRISWWARELRKTGLDGSMVPAGFVGRVNLTVPLATLLGPGDRD
jgi:hypothetical protein